MVSRGVKLAGDRSAHAAVISTARGAVPAYLATAGRRRSGAWNRRDSRWPGHEPRPGQPGGLIGEGGMPRRGPRPLLPEAGSPAYSPSSARSKPKQVRLDDRTSPSRGRSAISMPRARVRPSSRPVLPRPVRLGAWRVRIEVDEAIRTVWPRRSRSRVCELHRGLEARALRRPPAALTLPARMIAPVGDRPCG